MGWSLFVTSNGQTTEHALAAVTKVGRGPECQVRIRHPHISKHHFTIHLGDGGATLAHAHLPDENPRGHWVSIHSYVNGERVMTTAPVALGDVITVKPPEAPEESVSIRVGPTENPAPPPSNDKPWWRFW